MLAEVFEEPDKKLLRVPNKPQDFVAAVTE